MRRSDLLALTGLSSNVFNTWRRRNCLPFEDPKEGGWGDYSIQNAIALDLAVSLVQIGVPQKRAGEFVRTLSKQLFSALRSAPRNTAFGCLYFQDVAEEREDGSGLEMLPFCCRFSELDQLSSLYPRSPTWPARRGMSLIDTSDRLDELNTRVHLTSDPVGLSAHLEAATS